MVLKSYTYTTFVGVSTFILIISFMMYMLLKAIKNDFKIKNFFLLNNFNSNLTSNYNIKKQRYITIRDK